MHSHSLQKRKSRSPAFQILLEMMPTPVHKSMEQHAARKSRDAGGLVELRRSSCQSCWSFTNIPVLVERPTVSSGVGVFALFDLEPGKCLIEEIPLAAWDIDASNAQTDVSELDRIVASLTPKMRQTFQGLWDVHDTSGHKSAFGIWMSNAYQREFGDAFAPAEDVISHGAVFAIICRINHSCRPNSHVAWNHGTLRQTVHALRPIQAGEEITVCYLGAGALSPRATRKAVLLRTKGFDCACAACCLRGEALEQSEERMRRLDELRTLLTDGREGASLVGVVDELWRLAEADGAPCAWLRAEAIAAMVHAQKAGADAQACAQAHLRWAQRGASSCALALGAGAPTTTKFEMVAKRALARVRAVQKS